MSIEVKRYCDICYEYIPRSAISMYRVTQYDNNLVMSTAPKKLEVCYECMKAIQKAIRRKKLFSADDVKNILIEHGQHDRQFRLGETILYDPLEIKTILEEHEDD